jgi:hypothetical protein
MSKVNITEGFVEYLNGHTVFNYSEYKEWNEEMGVPYGTYTYWLRKNAVGTGTRGEWELSLSATAPTKKSKPKAKTTKAKVVPIKAVEKTITAQVKSVVNEDCYIPAKVKEFVKWGYTKDIEVILKSRVFFPMYIAGLSGNGKTMMVEQACANAKREYIRIQITPETDEDDLIGGFRLLDGETVFAKGPVIKAMEAGAILLIDEIDRGSNKLMALQGVLEGKPVMIKKTGEVVTPAEGFNVIATANTKGRGDDEGKFISATIIDEAFLERFNITLDQPYPIASVEKRIVINHMTKYEANDAEYAEKLVKWAVAIRKTFMDGGVDDFISTRRLCHIVQTFSIFKDRMKAIELCVNRYDTETREAFMDLYANLDDSISIDDLEADAIFEDAVVAQNQA